MEDSTKNIELIDRFMANEKKSKLWTTINIGIFCLLGMSIFFLAYELNKSNEKYKLINEQLEKTQDSLATALAKLDSYNGSLKQDSISLSKRVGNFDSLKNVLDTVVDLFKQSQAKIIDSGKMQTNARIDDIAQKAYEKKNIAVSDDIKQIIFDKDQQTAGGTPVYTLYLQCMPGFEELMPALAKDLRARKYKIPKWEVIKGVTFNPVIKYFDKSDQEEAKRLAAFINQSNDFFRKKPVQIQKLNLKSPQHQIEVWVGEYRQNDLQQIVQQSAQYKKS